MQPDNDTQVVVTQADREVGADIWRDYVARIGEVMVERSLRAGGLDDGLPTILGRHRAAASTGAIPDGMVLVPREATPEMVAAWWRQKNCGSQDIAVRFGEGDDFSDFAAYRALLAAAPTPPAPSEQSAPSREEVEALRIRNQEAERQSISRQLSQALRYKNEERFRAIAFVHRHTILAALSEPARVDAQPTPEQGDVERILAERISNYQAMRDECVEAGRDENAYALVVEALERLQVDIALTPVSPSAATGGEPTATPVEGLREPQDYTRSFDEETAAGLSLAALPKQDNPK